MATKHEKFQSSSKRWEDNEEEWTADLSHLFIGKKFASGAYSRIYGGTYKQRAVAVKMVSTETHKEETRPLLEQQFKSEVALLSRLDHPNILQNKRPPLPASCQPALAHLIERCWAANPSKRPDFNEIVSTLEKYDQCAKEGLPLTLHSGLVSRNTIIQRLKGCVSMSSFVPVHA